MGIWKSEDGQYAIIEGAEVFDSEGTLALRAKGTDAVHVSRVWTDDGPVLSDSEYQAVIDAIVTAVVEGGRG